MASRGYLTLENTNYLILLVLLRAFKQGLSLVVASGHWLAGLAGKPPIFLRSPWWISKKQKGHSFPTSGGFRSSSWRATVIHVSNDGFVFPEINHPATIKGYRHINGSPFWGSPWMRSHRRIRSGQVTRVSALSGSASSKSELQASKRTLNKIQHTMYLDIYMQVII